MIWEETKKQGLELNDQNVGMIANDMRKTHGKDIWAKRTLEKINSMKKTDLLVIDGVRNIEEIETFEKELGKDFLLVGIDVSDDTRYTRAMNRGREDDSMDLNLIKERDRRELSWGLGNVIASADVIITNEGSFEEFRDKVIRAYQEERFLNNQKKVNVIGDYVGFDDNIQGSVERFLENLSEIMEATTDRDQFTLLHNDIKGSMRRDSKYGEYPNIRQAAYDSIQRMFRGE